MKTGYIDHRQIDGYASVQPVAQQYGRWEIRAKVPTSSTTARGALAAFWLRNSGTITVGGPTGAEIDIFESWGSGPLPKPNPDTSTLTLHRYTSKPDGGTDWKLADQYEPIGMPPVSDDFHIWAFERTPDYCAAYRDGLQTFYSTPAMNQEIWESTFTSPFHIRINLHVGPSAQYWGLPDWNNKQWTLEPLDYQIDYVRVWSNNTP